MPSSGSSGITVPAVPPCSSTANAKWMRFACVSRNRLIADLDSGTKWHRRRSSACDERFPVHTRSIASRHDT